MHDKIKEASAQPSIGTLEVNGDYIEIVSVHRGYIHLQRDQHIGQWPMTGLVTVLTVDNEDPVDKLKGYQFKVVLPDGVSGKAIKYELE